MNAEVTKYLVTDNRGEFVIEIPKTGWKLTFGYVNPAIPDGGVRGAQGHCLRVYEGKDQLRAVFGNVQGIRDLAIPLARKVEKQTGSDQWTMDSEGNFDRETTRRALPAEWLTGNDAEAFE